MLAIPTVWLNIHTPRVFDGVDAPITASLRLKASWDVVKGDVLEAQQRFFCVEQLKPEQSTQLVFCRELAAFIPDEFTSGILNPWWTASGAGTWTPEGGKSTLRLTPPVVSTPAEAGFLAQTVKTEFSAIVNLICPVGSAGAVHRALLGFRTGTLGCYVGVRGHGAQAVLRLDDNDGSITETVVVASATWLRLQRIGCGCDFLACYATTTHQPDEADWVLLTPSGLGVQSSAAGQLGLGGYVASGVAQAMTFECFR